MAILDWKCKLHINLHITITWALDVVWMYMYRSYLHKRHSFLFTTFQIQMVSKHFWTLNFNFQWNTSFDPFQSMRNKCCFHEIEAESGNIVMYIVYKSRQNWAGIQHGNILKGKYVHKILTHTCNSVSGTTHSSAVFFHPSAADMYITDYLDEFCMEFPRHVCMVRMYAVLRQKSSISDVVMKYALKHPNGNLRHPYDDELASRFYIGNIVQHSEDV